MQEGERQAHPLALAHRELVDAQVADLGEIEARVAELIAAARASRVEERQPRPEVEVALRRSRARRARGRPGVSRPIWRW